jgi:hypothetical protein
MHIPRTCQFLLDKEADKPDAKLRYRIKWNRRRNIVAFNLGYRVDIAKWSRETQRCINNTTHGKKKIAARIINKEIEHFEKIAEETFEYFQQCGREPSTEDFRQQFNQRIGKTNAGKINANSFFDIFDKYLEQTSALHTWERRTFENYHALKTHLQNFNPNLTFADLTENILIEFVKYLQTLDSGRLRHDNKTSGLRNSTIAEKIVVLRSFLRWASKNGCYNGRLHETFHPKFKGADGNSRTIVYLSWDELLRLLNFNFDNQEQRQVRDVLCIVCHIVEN